MFVSVHGFNGGFADVKPKEAEDIAKLFLYDGYYVRVDNLQVVLHHGPGYDFVVWGDGENTGQPINPSDGM